MKTITGALGRLLWYSLVFKEHLRGLRVKISTTCALGRLSTIGVLGRLFKHSIILQEHWGGCADTTEYYRSTGEAVLAQYNTTGEVERMCRYNKVLYEYG